MLLSSSRALRSILVSQWELRLEERGEGEEEEEAQDWVTQSLPPPVTSAAVAAYVTQGPAHTLRTGGLDGRPTCGSEEIGGSIREMCIGGDGV